MIGLKVSAMASILIASGFKNLESLQDFCNRFPNISNCLDKELQKIWICHKNSEEIPRFEDVHSLPDRDYYYLSTKVGQKIANGKPFYSLLTEFTAFYIFDKIYSQCNKQLTTYLFTKCYLFYNWGINAFEPIIDHFEIHLKIQEKQNKCLRGSWLRLGCNFLKNVEFKDGSKTGREKSVDLFEESSSVSSKPMDFKTSNMVSYKSMAQAIEKAKKFYEFSKNSRNPYQETFNLNKILYDTKQRRNWARKHVLSSNNVEDLITFIIKIPLVTNTSFENKFLSEHKNWIILKELLGEFIKSHGKISKYNGYRRILKKHLRNVKTQPDRRLQPIPKAIVCSYVLDILRRVLPIELFGRNRLRKNFFKELVKVLKGNKNENFIWRSLLRSLLLNKFSLSWCTQLGENFIQGQVLLKLFKFIVIHYVFVLLRNNFYVTETGSSVFGLRYYRKSDMESRSFVCVNSLLRGGQIRRLGRKDYSSTTIEMKWLKTGIISEEDLRSRIKKKMSPETEYNQPIARVRFLPKSDNSDGLRIITHIMQQVPKTSDLNCGSKKLKKYFLTRLARRKKNLFFVKLFLDFLVDKIGFGIKPLPSNPHLEVAWKKAVHLREKFGKLFFVKADISDAFNSVNYNILYEVLRGAFEKESEQGKVQLKKIIEWKKTNWKIQKVVRFSFSNRAGENSVMINRSFFLHPNKKINRSLDMKLLLIIKQVAMQQKMEIKGRIYKLIKGLAQGSAGRFSPKLCEIYYSSMDNLHFGQFINSSDSILLRAVDDYLFISSDFEKATQFLKLVQNGIDDYNVRFNGHKLKSNLIESVQNVTYLGLVFNFEDMSVKPNYSKYRQGNLLSTINLLDKWNNNHFKKNIFLERRSLRILCLKLHPIVTSGFHNDLKVMRQTVFEASLMQSLRVMALACYLYPGEMKHEAAVYKALLVSCCKIKSLLAPCELSRDEVNWLFFFAAVNILHKYSGRFKLVSLMVRFRMQKCEEAFNYDGGKLLLNFLKGDILDTGYWENVRNVFGELRELPIKPYLC